MQPPNSDTETNRSHQEHLKILDINLITAENLLTHKVFEVVKTNKLKTVYGKQ